MDDLDRPAGGGAVFFLGVDAKRLVEGGGHVVRRDGEADESSRELDRVKATVSRGNGMRVDTVAAVGKDVAATICATAERVGADAVIVGRHTRSRASQFFLGTVSGEVLARSRRPVLVVPDPATI